jgi:mRNA interferase MazF
MLPKGLDVEGAILVDQLRSIDRRERILRHLGTAPREIVEEVHLVLAALAGMTIPET